MDQGLNAFFISQTADITVIILLVVILFSGPVRIGEIAEPVDFGSVETALNHFIRHKPAGADKCVGNCFKTSAGPFFCFSICQKTCQSGVFHAFVIPDLLFVCEALFADLLSVAQAVIARTKQFVIMQGPYHLDALLMSDFGNNGGVGCECC